MVEVPTGSNRSGTRWPQDLLDVDALRESGWRPYPFRQFVLKVHSRCNLSCSYCYIYHQADQSWRVQPTRMSKETLVATAERIAEHARRHRLPDVQVVFHGGEPLLAGLEFLSFSISTLRRTVPTDVGLNFNLQTNGVLLDWDILYGLATAGVKIGISLDGGVEQQNQQRRGAAGRNSFKRIIDNVRQLSSSAFRESFSGVLCVVDLDSDPIEVYESLLDLQPPALDFLLPHGNWTSPPEGRTGDTTETPYAAWLAEIFDRWYGAPRQETAVRLFQEIINLLFGGKSRTESVGLVPSTVLVVETDGSLEQVDALKSTYQGAAATGLNVRDHPLDAALDHPGVVARQIGRRALSDTCQGCRVRDVCGGGYYPHRYRADIGFRNPSVYCPDLLEIITHIERRLNADLVRWKGNAQ